MVRERARPAPAAHTTAPSRQSGAPPSSGTPRAPHAPSRRDVAAATPLAIARARALAVGQLDLPLGLVRARPRAEGLALHDAGAPVRRAPRVRVRVGRRRGAQARVVLVAAADAAARRVVGERAGRDVVVVGVLLRAVVERVVELDVDHVRAAAAAERLGARGDRAITAPTAFQQR